MAALVSYLTQNAMTLISANGLSLFPPHMKQDKTPANMLQFVIRNKLQASFPNDFVALRLFLTLPVSNCEGERTFSKLKRIKNELRTTMGQKRLSALSLMAVESELVRGLDFEDIITEFSKKKSRKKNF